MHQGVKTRAFPALKLPLNQGFGLQHKIRYQMGKKKIQSGHGAGKAKMGLKGIR